jgi:hypothetical protein
MTEQAAKNFFIHREISLTWFKALSQCGGACVQTGIVLRYWLFLNKSDKISVSSRRFEEFGISKFQKLRALRKLEEQGLIKVERRPGANPEVTVVDPPLVQSN